MDRRQRMTLLGIAAVIAGAAVVIALVAGGGDDGDDTNANTTAAQTQTTGEADGATAPETTTTTEPPPEPEPARVRVKGGQPVGGVEKIEFENGDEAMIDVVADAADELHLHGYDIEKDVAPGQTARFRFDADIEGIFELELHSTGTQIAEITVKP